MSTRIKLDLTDLRHTWQARRAALLQILERFDTRGMTRPARAPEERAWLQERGAQLFVEDEMAGRAARAYYERKYWR